MSDQAVAVRTAPQPPVVPGNLAAEFAGYIDGWTPAKTLPAPVVDAARELAGQFEAYLAPASPELVELWMRQLRKGTATIAEEDFKHRLDAVLMASGDLPAWVWCKEALRECLRSPACRFFPSAADLDGLLRPRAKAARHAAWLAQQAAKARVAADAFDATKAVPAGLLPSLAAELRMPAGGVSGPSSMPFQPAPPGRAPGSNIPARPLPPEVRAALRRDPNLRVSMAGE